MALPPGYSAYINSCKWKSTRARKFFTAGRRCEKCGSRKRLVCHHLSYANFGNEPDEDLQVLCEDCHNVLHGGSPRGMGKSKGRKKKGKTPGAKDPARRQTMSLTKRNRLAEIMAKRWPKSCGHLADSQPTAQPEQPKTPEAS